MFAWGYLGGGLGKNLDGRMRPVEVDKKRQTSRHGIGWKQGYNKGRPQGHMIPFIKGQNDPRVNLSDSPHFTPSDLANRNLNDLIQWNTSSFSWEGLRDAGIPARCI